MTAGALLKKLGIRRIALAAAVLIAAAATPNASAAEAGDKPLVYGPPTGMEWLWLPEVAQPVPIAPTSGGVYGLAHTHVITADLEKSLHFYVNILGFTQIMAIQDISEDPPTNERMNVLLGFENARLRHAMVSLPGGPSYLKHVPQIEFWEVRGPAVDETLNRAPAGNLRGKGYNAYMVKDLDRLLARMKAEGIRFVSEVLTSPGGKSIYVVDPDGQLIELNEFYAEWGGDDALAAGGASE